MAWNARDVLILFCNRLSLMSADDKFRTITWFLSLAYIHHITITLPLINSRMTKNEQVMWRTNTNTNSYLHTRLKVTLAIGPITSSELKCFSLISFQVKSPDYIVVTYLVAFIVCRILFAASRHSWTAIKGSLCDLLYYIYLT